MTSRAAGLLLAGPLLLAGTGCAADPPRVGDEAYRAIARFYEYDPQVPLDARVVERDEAAPTYVREKVVFTGSRGDHVPGWLMLPKAGARPFPVVVILDGWMGSKDRWWADDTWPQGGLLTKALAAEGIGALVLDAQFHGERADAIGFKPVEEHVCPRCASERTGMVVETVMDYRRALDYLATRQELDRGRMGAIGFSMGGLMTTALAAVDGRLRAAVTCVTPVRPNDPWWSGAEMSPLTFAPRVRVPMLVLMGRTDGLYSQADAEAYRDALGSPEKTLEWYDSGHRLPPEYVPRAVGWLKDHLK